MTQKPASPSSPARRRFIVGATLLLILFLALVIADTFRRYPQPWFYIFLIDLHFQLSRLGLVVAGAMVAAGAYIGIVRKGDVTPLFRSATYFIFGMMLLQALIGVVMYSQGGRPLQDVHLIYGMACVLVLPFFIFVETTARKRPAMGSYIWGFALLLGILLRSVMTGS
ncbi:MAG: hypothetical protein K8J31_10675 [Anaerolineae bacterium]|nr:hypothetical protein [Anaerolineae bacterium]